MLTALSENNAKRMMSFGILTTLLFYLTSSARCGNVLMVIGGQYFNVSTREHDMVGQVEVIGAQKTCEIAPLPSPVYGLAAGLIGRDSVLACGGYNHYYRNECYEYSRHSKQWRLSHIRLEPETGFPAGTSDRGQFILGGGRHWNYSDPANPWVYHSSLFSVTPTGLESMGELPEPVADHCMLVTKSGGRRRLWVIGGSSAPQRYKVEVFAKDMDSHQPSWIRMPDLLDKRMWQGCVETKIGYQLGILVVGGYYNGVSSMFLPLENERGQSLESFGLNRNMPRWEFVGGLTKERKWAPAFGFIGSELVAAGGGDYGCETVDVMQRESWTRSTINMLVKREFAVGVTVPSHWFPECLF